MLSRFVKKCMIISLISACVGCASSGAKKKEDPYEAFNREMFGFNQFVDKGFIKPVAYLYSTYLPKPLVAGISNFFDNINIIPTVANDLLQFKFRYAAHDTSRFLINSTVGILGFFDAASALGLEAHSEDFGQTLYHLGYKDSTYLVLPIVGPSTTRDAIGLGVDYGALHLWPYIDTDWLGEIAALEWVDTRARYLRHEKVIDVIAIDEYALMRDAYLQRREYLFTGQDETGIDDSSDPYAKAMLLKEGELMADEKLFPEEEINLLDE